MRRPAPVRPAAKNNLSERDCAVLASRAEYIGSPHHKDTPSFAGNQPAPRSGAKSVEQIDAEGIESPDCTICPRKWARRQEAATDLLREAIRNGHMSGDAGPTSLPKRVWARDPDTPGIVYEARRLSWPETGYKAYPLSPAQARAIPIVLPWPN